MSEQEISYTYMADEAGNYVIFKPDGDYMSPQSLCDYLNALEHAIGRIVDEAIDAAQDLASLPTQQKPTEEGMEEA